MTLNLSSQLYRPQRAVLNLATEYTEINKNISMPCVFSVAICPALV